MNIVEAFWEDVKQNVQDYDWFNDTRSSTLRFDVVPSTDTAFREGRKHDLPRRGDILIGIALAADEPGEEAVTMDIMGYTYDLALKPGHLTFALHGRTGIPTCAFWWSPVTMTTRRQLRFHTVYASCYGSLSMAAVFHPVDDTHCVYFVHSMCGRGEISYFQQRASTTFLLPDLTRTVVHAAHKRTRRRALAIKRELMEYAWHPSRMGRCMDVEEADAFGVQAVTRRLHDVVWIADGVCLLDAMFEDAECARLVAKGGERDLRTTMFVRDRLSAFVRWARPCGLAGVTAGAHRDDYVLRVFLCDHDRPTGFHVRPKRGRAVILSMAVHNAHPSDDITFKLRSTQVAYTKSYSGV